MDDEGEKTVIETPEQKREFLLAQGMSEVEVNFLLAVESGELPEGDVVTESDDDGH